MIDSLTMAITPLAPGRFSITNGCPVRSDRCCATARATAFDAQLRIPTVACQDAVDSVPAGFAPMLEGLRCEGELSYDVKASLDTAHMDSLKFELGAALHAADRADVAQNGRGPMRRLNRDEYEQNLRDLLQLPHLDIRDMLPEDREAYHFHKVSEALDISRVQLAAYLDATEAALRQAMVTSPTPPAVQKFRASGFDLFPGLRSTGGIESMFFIKGNQGINVATERPAPLTPEQKSDPSIEMGLFRSPG